MKSPEHEDTMQPEYDFSEGRRGKYAKLYARGTNLVLLAPDVAKCFPDSDSVNDALRVIAKLARRRKVLRRAE